MSAEFRILLGGLIEAEVDLRAANKNLTASRDAHSSTMGELLKAQEALKIETTKREQAEKVAVQTDHHLAAVRRARNDIRAQRDVLYQAAKALFAVKPQRRSQVAAARSALAALLTKLEPEVEIPF